MSVNYTLWPKKRAIDQISSTFSPASAQDWSQIAQKEIENKNPWEALAWSDQNNLFFKPYYDAITKDHFVFALKPAKNTLYGARAWYNMPQVIVDHAKNANERAMLHLNNGADGILFDLQGKEADLKTLLKDIQWQYCALSFKNTHKNFSKALIDYIQSENLDKSNLQGSLFSIDVNEETIAFFEKTSFQPVGLWLDAEAKNIDTLYQALIQVDALFKNPSFKKTGYDCHLH